MSHNKFQISIKQHFFRIFALSYSKLVWQTCFTSVSNTSMSQGQELLLIFGWRIVKREEEGGTLTARSLVILVIWEEIIQSLFAGVRVFLLLKKKSEGEAKWYCWIINEWTLSKFIEMHYHMLLFNLLTQMLWGLGVLNVMIISSLCCCERQ